MPFISTHTHFENPLTGSTQEDLFRRAHALGRTHMVYTDIGTMTGTYKAYKLAQGDKKKKIAPIKFIAGMEMMVERSGGYTTITVHARDQKAYQALVKVASKPRGLHISKKTGDEYPTYHWADIQELAKHNVTFTLSGVHSAYVRPVLEGNREQADIAVDELLNMKPNDVYVALVAASEDSVQHRYIEIQVDYPGWVDEKMVNKRGKITVRADQRMKTNYGEFIPVKELLRPYHSHKSIIHFHGAGELPHEMLFVSAKEVPRYAKLQMGNAIKRANMLHFMLAKKRNLKMLVTDYAFMASADDKIVQNTRSEGHTIQPDYYMMSDEQATEALSAHGIPVESIKQALRNSEEWAATFNDFKLKYDWRLPKITSEDTEKYMMDIINSVGRMKWDDPVYVERLKYEIQTFVHNGVYDFGPYFFPIAKVFEEYKKAGRLTGPGRGSVTGSLMSYAMGFTHIDPIEYDLPFERFFSPDRIAAKKLPDVDIDLPNRDLLCGLDAQSGWLYGFFGDKAAQISTRGMLRLKSSILDVNRVRNNGLVEDDVKTFAETLPPPPQGVSDADWVFGYENSDKEWVKGVIETSEFLQSYATGRPEEWAIVSKMLGIPRQNSRHASAFVICDVPVSDVVPTMSVNGVANVTQYEAKEVESAGLIKYDFLSLSTLIDIEGCLNRIQAKDKTSYEIGWFNHNGKKTYIWDLPKTDEKTAGLLERGEVTGLFQFDTNSMLPFVLDIKPKNIIDCAVILALVRPGPLDYIDEKLGINMAQKYVKLRKHEMEPDNETLARLLPESYGVIVFQEQLTKIARDLAMMPGPRAEILRDNMCKKRKVEFEAMKPEFMEKATQNASKEDCEMIWNMMATFGQYGFSVNHATAYAAITWATAFLKAHYPLEFWASVLTNADNKQINEKYWKFVSGLVAPPDINISTNEMVVDYTVGKIRSKMSVISGLGEKVMDKVMEARPFDGIVDFVRKGVLGDSMTKKLIHVGVADSLFPPGGTLIDKMQAYEDAVEQVKFEAKMADYQEKVKVWSDKMHEHERLLELGEKSKKPTEPKRPVLKRGTIDPKYLSMSPYEDYSIKKQILPSMQTDLTKLVMEISDKVSRVRGKMPTVVAPNGKTSRLVNGPICRVYENRTQLADRDYFACAGLLISVKPFTMKKKGTQALKVVLDTDGHLRELVKWPDYNTNELEYPKEMKKGDVVFVFFDQKPGRPPRISDLALEYSLPKDK